MPCIIKSWCRGWVCWFLFRQATTWNSVYCDDEIQVGNRSSDGLQRHCKHTLEYRYTKQAYESRLNLRHTPGRMSHVILQKIFEISILHMSLKIVDLRLQPHLQGLYSLSGKTSYRQISRSLEVARLDVTIIVSLWNLTGISAALLLRCLSNFRAMGQV